MSTSRYDPPKKKMLKLLKYLEAQNKQMGIFRKTTTNNQTEPNAHDNISQGAHAAPFLVINKKNDPMITGL